MKYFLKHFKTLIIIVYNNTLMNIEYGIEKRHNDTLF